MTFFNKSIKTKKSLVTVGHVTVSDLLFSAPCIISCVETPWMCYFLSPCYAILPSAPHPPNPPPPSFLPRMLISSIIPVVFLQVVEIALKVSPILGAHMFQPLLPAVLRGVVDGEVGLVFKPPGSPVCRSIPRKPHKQTDSPEEMIVQRHVNIHVHEYLVMSNSEHLSRCWKVLRFSASSSRTKLMAWCFFERG